MSEPFLILHKVRGEPAFDIAIQHGEGTESDPGPWWIIPTSGHRAYPFRYWELAELADISDYPHAKPYFKDELPEDWPDHYSCNHSSKPTGIGREILARLGLIKPAERERRRD